MASHRILYVGRDHSLLDFLSDVLKKTNDTIVRCPDGRGARLFIESDINYSLLLFDGELPDTTGLMLARFTREQAHRVSTPVIILSVGEASCDVAGVSLVKSFDAGSILETITVKLQRSKI